MICAACSLTSRPGPLLELGAETPGEGVHLADVLGAGHDRSRRDDGVLLRLRPHPQLEVRDALLRQFALGERLLAELVEQAPGDGLLRERLGEGGRVLPGQQPVQVGAGPGHELVVLRHAAKAGLHGRSRRLPRISLVELHDLRVRDPLGVLDPRLDPAVDHRADPLRRPRRRPPGRRSRPCRSRRGRRAARTNPDAGPRRSPSLGACVTSASRVCRTNSSVPFPATTTLPLS